MIEDLSEVDNEFSPIKTDNLASKTSDPKLRESTDGVTNEIKLFVTNDQEAQQVDRQDPKSPVKKLDRSPTLKSRTSSPGLVRNKNGRKLTYLKTKLNVLLTDYNNVTSRKIA